MLGPVQVLVVGVPGEDGARALMAELATLPADGPVRCIDVFECAVGPHGQLTVAADDPAPLSLALFAEMVDDDAVPAPAVEGSWHLGEVVPPGSRAVVAVVEHQWALGLRDSMRAAGGSIRYETWLDDDDRATLETLLDSRAG
jgi:hypothetical protein